MSKFLLFPFFFFFFLPAAASAQVAKIIFITEPQNISPDTLSEPITIQAIDSDGNEYKTLETLDLQFKSTSATGSFLNSSGNPASDYMSKNTAKRTFYYKDSSAGNFTLTVIATGRESGEEWSASQDITVGDSLSSPASSKSESGSFSSGSSGSNSSPASKASVSEPLEISSGGDRVVSVGSPIDFKASIKKNSMSDGAKFSWSFGDGFVGAGQRVVHTYKYPGTYAVALNAKSAGNSATHKVKVKVIEPKISLSLGEDYIEVSNDMQNDLELFNWKLVSGGKAFIFQPDTVILAGSKIKISKSLLFMKGQAEWGTILKNTLGEIVAIYELPIPTPAVAIYKSKPVATSVAGTSTIATGASSSAVIYEAPTQRGFVARTLSFFANIFK